MMPIDKQVCSLELAKKLNELGVKQESLFWWVQFSNGCDKGHRSYKTNLHWEIRYDKGTLYNFPERIAAFTCAELGEILPKGILTQKSRTGFICHRDFTDEMIGLTESDARAKMLIYLLESGLIGKEPS